MSHDDKITELEKRIEELMGALIEIRDQRLAFGSPYYKMVTDLIDKTIESKTNGQE